MFKHLIRTGLWILLIQISLQELSPNQISKAKDSLISQMEERNIAMIEQLVREKFIPNNINVSSELENLKLEIMQDLSELEQRLKPKKEPQNVRPVFKWGQTYRKIFINLKYSHRFDAPGCLDVYNQTLKFVPVTGSQENSKKTEETEGVGDEDEEMFTGRLKGKAKGRGLRLSAECQVADLVFRYFLNFDLFDEVTAWSIDKGKWLFWLIERECWDLFDYSLQEEKGNLALDL